MLMLIKIHYKLLFHFYVGKSLQLPSLKPLVIKTGGFGLECFPKIRGLVNS